MAALLYQANISNDQRVELYSDDTETDTAAGVWLIDDQKHHEIRLTPEAALALLNFLAANRDRLQRQADSDRREMLQ
jgi:hypothetical protein